MGIEKPIRIRTGIDYGETKDVLWSRYGIPGCDELTTTSLHTDLAAKLQQRVHSNGVIIGDNVKVAMDIDEKYLSVRKFTEGGIDKEDKVIKVSSKIHYPMWVFDFEKYLLSYSCCKREDNRIEFVRPTKRLRCIRLDTEFEYFENSYAIDKNTNLKFELLNQHGTLLVNDPVKKIEWKIVNTGKEATSREHVIIPLTGAENKTSVTVDTAYLGQHKIQCTIGGFLDKEIFEFYVFVKPDKLLTA